MSVEACMNLWTHCFFTAGKLRFLGWIVALCAVLTAPLRGQVMYGDFPENHVFDPPIYVLRINGVAGDRYFFTTRDPQGKPVGVDFVVADRVFYYKDYTVLGGPIYSPAEAAALVPEGALVTDTSQEQRFYGRSPGGASPVPSLPQTTTENQLLELLRIPAVRFALITLIIFTLISAFKKLTPKANMDPETPTSSSK